LFGLIGSSRRRQDLSKQAAHARADVWRRWAAIIAVAVYNLVGVADIYSTVSALETGVGYEANPVVRTMMAHLNDGWVIAKLFLQAVISFMVLWFPHWIVIGLFSVAVLGNVAVVYNNFSIVGFV